MAKARRKARPVDEDDDDVPRIGRPRTPEPFGPPKPELHQRKEWRDRLQSLLDAVEIDDLPDDARDWLQRVLWRSDLLFGGADGSVTLLLRTIFESANGAPALTLPILRAVSGCLHHDVWADAGLRLLDAMDQIDLVGLHRILSDLGLEDQLDRVVRMKLQAILGPPVAPPKPKPRPAPKPKAVRPPNVDEKSWSEVEEWRRRSRQETNRRCYARRKLKAATV